MNFSRWSKEALETYLASLSGQLGEVQTDLYKTHQRMHHLISRRIEVADELRSRATP